MKPLAKDLTAFARQSGYHAIACPSCGRCAAAAGGASISRRVSTCTNCGGTGRLWTSLCGSLSDDGLARLRRMVEGGPATES